MKIYNKLLFIKRILFCSLIVCSIFFTEKMFWFLVSSCCNNVDEGSKIAGMFSLHIFYAGIILSLYFFFKNVDHQSQEFLKYIGKNAESTMVGICCISIFLSIERCMLWIIRFNVPKWDWYASIFFTCFIIFITAIIIVIIASWKFIYDSIKRGIMVFYKWITGEKEADEFLDNV